MRHRKKFNHLSRKSAHRKAMFANMASSLILHKKIKTTLPKAKALRVFIEPLITKAKYTYTLKTKVEEATHLRRVVFSYLKQKKAVTELFSEVAPKVVNRNGGYTRILKLGKRQGDNAELCFIELVDFNENMLKAKEEAKQEKEQPQKTTRRGRRGRGGKPATEEIAPPEAKKEEEIKAPEAKDEAKDESKDEPKEKTEETAQTAKKDEETKAPKPKSPEAKTEPKEKTEETAQKAKKDEETKAPKPKLAEAKSKPKEKTEKVVEETPDAKKEEETKASETKDKPTEKSAETEKAVEATSKNDTEKPTTAKKE